MDIVERLRQRIALVKFDSDAIALHDAANIIEQLRRQVEFERKCREDTYADLEKQDAEIERLRKALRLAGDRVEPLASFQQKDIGSSTIRVGEETKFSRDARSFNGEK